MSYWLARKRSAQQADFIQRFDPRFWTVNFARPAMAAATTPAPDSLRIDAVFQKPDDLIGVIWESEDKWDHPLLAYETARDYSRLTVSFRWRSGGVLPLDAVYGPTLTIEGRDAAGKPRTWYVRLWNYAQGSREDARITLPFSRLAGGFLHPAEADPVHAADIDRMFISLVPPGYGSSGAAFAQPRTGWAELSEIRCEGHRPMLAIGDVMVPPHGLAICTGYDDAYNQTPARLLRAIRGLGYRGSITHYIGMSHFFCLVPGEEGFVVDPALPALNDAALAWHRDFFAGAERTGYTVIASQSYELLAQHCPALWQQRTYDGTPARTGWSPPSALLSPANAAAMAWLQKVAKEITGLLRACSLPVRVQIGEPWWWVTADGKICLYDAAARAAFGGAPPEIPDLRRAVLNASQRNLLDRAGALLAASTAGIVDSVRAAAAPGRAELLLLVYLPTVLDPVMPEARRANLPAGWASPAFDTLQLEDYDWVTCGCDALHERGRAAAEIALGYPRARQHYLAGFVLKPEDAAAHWPLIDAAASRAIAAGVAETFIWALPQVCRDGFTRVPDHSKDQQMQAFDDVPYPLPLGRDTEITTEFSTQVMTTAAGFEQRNSLWADARLRFDVGPGIRSEAELAVLVAFFRARRGAARGFRLRDPTDFSSNAMTAPPTALDQLIGTGDGATARFALIKAYGAGVDAQVRRITRPRSDTVRVSVGGVETRAFSVDTRGVVVLAAAPAAGEAVRAGFLFDVPVRFAEDRLDMSGAAFAAGAVPSVPLIELREEA